MATSQVVRQLDVIRQSFPPTRNVQAMQLAVVFLPFIGIGVAGLALSIWAVVDVLSRPDWAFQAAGSSKTLWIVLEAIGLFVCGGIVLSLVYLLAVRPKVSRAAMFGTIGPAGPTGWIPPRPGPPPSSWTQPPPAPPSGWTEPPPAGRPSAPQSPPGWYPDPAGSGGWRYWDGATWSEQVW